MLTIYHNPRCRKSRDGLALLEKSGEVFETVLYLENKPSKEKLTTLIDQLGIEPEALVRKNEAIWKENFKGKELSAAQIIAAMVQYPKLIERPIVVKGTKAVIGRPIENIINLLEE